MDRKLTEQRFPSSDMLREYNKINETNEQFMKSLTDPDKGIVVSSSVLKLKDNNLEVTAEQIELHDSEGVSYKLTVDHDGKNLTEGDLQDLVDVTDRYSYMTETNEDLNITTFVLKEDK